MEKLISFRTTWKLGSYLVRTALYPIERNVESFKCKGTMCQTCLNVNEKDAFNSTTTVKTK